ncbi:hypothetical protein EN904_09560 [Mesorhizobium sp. M7A.F.Ca.CA.001.07.2.1]|uniref:hypothetical protein n=1 Tax=Mesorhizobium TaxID=68287 RepID=UPI000FCC47AB|nr:MULTISPECIES: hypothetical protein [Mesorhizobium]RVB19875.1 hypothetical protein EN918_31920 [Mesorhizobium sp. M7A.F.Ca.CA.004.05.1.1]RVC29029.1 hypothetical protein EN893_19140 [Mesorhizobium sp. M7A.F.Ca.CA.004.04.2.1]MCF6124269.1 gluconate 2-dehydrogenase subunit 3 family protein [Mesorhizobium ciceri]MCQ8816770.1 gluconate 2-dehydrogenase subunit 3 family protein [Mesorhizobium sp. SEMIA396]MCQ8872401.1 gluconate 2-dehydrogenase subunit 3 family protein [Mesorhizobium sp. LMG17149]
MIRALVDELIPGNESWPSASEAGVHGIVSMRLFADWSDVQTTALADLLGWERGGLSSSNGDTRIAAVKVFEQADAELFDKIYTAVTLAYYETPFVIEAIRNTGRPYSHRPHLTGYDMAPFDFNRDQPAHRRGHYLETEKVRPVDTSPLGLDTVMTDRWGLER